MATKSKTTKPAAKKAGKKRFVKKGFMGSSETVPLAIAAREALTFQIAQGLEDEGTDFKAWRHAQVRDVTGRDGLTECESSWYKPLMARFKLLAGKDVEAFELEMKTGKVTTSGAPDDTHENRKGVVFQIREELTAHIRLADLDWPQLLEEFDAAGRDGKWVVKAMDRKLHIEKEGGPVREGYIVTTVRGKTRRPDLNLGSDIWAGLAERCTLKQLRDLLSTIVNRIAAKEGTGSPANRNRKQKTPKARTKRSSATLEPRIELPLHDPRD